MTKRFLSVCLMLCLLVTSVGVATAASADVPTGYYNLADFEALAGAPIAEYKEAPMLAEKVAAGTLPPLSERLPENPLVLRTLDTVGEFGGDIQISDINADRDWNLRHMNCANLIERPASSAWDAMSTVFGATMQPGIFESFAMSEDGTEFTARIRKGLKWSDGAPCTTADVEFIIKDFFLNKELKPTPPAWVTWGGGQTELTIVDEQEFKLTFAKPYGSFIEIEVDSWSAKFYRWMYPSAYLKQYHKDYAKPEELLAKMNAEGYKTIEEWPSFFNEKTKLWGQDNMKLDNGKPYPTLDPWVLTEDLGNSGRRLERNPYFYMVDQAGNQLPYADNLVRTYVGDQQAQNMDILAGKVDISSYSLGVQDYPLFKENEDKGNFICMPLTSYHDQPVIIGFNTSVADPVKASIYGDLRFRQALSVALDRNTITETVYLGIGTPANVAPRKGTVDYQEGQELNFAQYDPALANQLLDEIGMKDVNGDGFREAPDGSEFVIRYEYFVLTAATTPISEYAKRYWEEVGIKTDLKLVDGAYWWASIQPNNTNEVTPWQLNGADANLANGWFIGPSMLVPKWAGFAKKGTVSDSEWAEIIKDIPEWQQQVQDLKVAMYAEADPVKRAEHSRKIWELVVENMPILGIATDTLAPMIVSKDLGNAAIAESMGYNPITMLEHAEQLYFTNPARR